MIAESTVKTEIGSYFIANYPPFSVWNAEDVPAVRQALAGEPDRSIAMGLYIHIPFCASAADSVIPRLHEPERPGDRELRSGPRARVSDAQRQPGVAGRRLRFAYSAEERRRT